MSTTLSHADRSRARKRHRCALCGESILPGDLQATRSGVDRGTMWTMHMHPECLLYESAEGVVDPDWYEDISDPAFDRADATAHAAKQAK